MRIARVVAVSLVEPRLQLIGREDSSANTTSVAQVSSRGLLSTAGKVRPTNLERILKINKTFTVYMHILQEEAGMENEGMYILQPADINIILQMIIFFKLKLSTFFSQVSHSCCCLLSHSHSRDKIARHKTQ